MKLSAEQHAAFAQALFEAERSGQQIGLLTSRAPEMDLDDAYAVQQALVAQKVAAGGRIIGWKIGLTSRAMQQALNIDIPDSGVLFEDMLFDDGAAVPAGRFIQPRVEAEIAFIMRADLAGNCTPADVLAATEAVVPALEILDTRIQRRDPSTGAPRKVFDTVADNAANAGLVLGAQRQDPRSLDLRWTGAIVSLNGSVEETGLGAGVLGDPLLSMAWLAERLGRYGQQIRSGDIVLSGSFIRPIECPGGTEISADFGAFGQVRCTFD